MKVLIPGQFSLVSSSVPVDEAQQFVPRVYAIGETVAYGEYVYRRLTATDTFPAFDNKTIYSVGSYVSHSGLNYICTAPTAMPTPAVDTARWTSKTSSAWATSTAYSAGTVVTRLGRTYACIAAHTSADATTAAIYRTLSLSDFYNGETFYPGQGMFYNGRYYGYNVDYPVTMHGAPAMDYFIDVSSVVRMPSAYSSYWIDITDNAWSPTIFYGVGSFVLYSGVAYYCTTAITAATPDIDTTTWQNSSTTLPTNPADWERVATLNRFKMFDQYLNTFTSAATSMALSIGVTDFNALYLGNIFAESVEVSVINNADSTVVENTVIDLTYDCVDIFDFFFGDWMDSRIDTVTYERTSVYRDVSLQLDFLGNTIRVGNFAIGKTYFIGTEPWGPQIEALDFSALYEDAITGEISLSRGNEVKVKSIDLWVDTDRMKATDEVLKLVRGIPAIYYGNNENLNTYGFIRKKTMILQNPTKSLISIEVRELI